MKTDKRQAVILSSPVFWGSAATITLLVFWVVLGFQSVCSTRLFAKEVCETKFSYLLSAPPNEIGDSLAGFAGVLAFIWIIVTVALQSKELREQRLVLTEQKEETRELREATQAMAAALETQANLIEEERKQRLIDNADRTLDELLKGLHWQICHEMTGRLNWQLRDIRGQEFNVTLRCKNVDTDFESSFLSMADHIAQVVPLLKAHEQNGLIENRPKRDSILDNIIRTASEIETDKTHASTHQNVRLKKLGTKQILDCLKEVRSAESLWSAEV